MSFVPKPHEIYRHFKGKLYQIVTIAEHSETGEQLVIYQALYGDFKTYARPLAMFVSPVDKEKYPDVTQEYRFELQGEQRERSAVTEGAGEKEMAKEPVKSEAGAASGKQEFTPGSFTEKPQQTENTETADLDPMLVQFLDADTYEERLNILAGVHHRITDDMITTMAVACDVEVAEGELEERYAALKTCLITLEKYECNRLR